MLDSRLHIVFSREVQNEIKYLKDKFDDKRMYL